MDHSIICTITFRANFRSEPHSITVILFAASLLPFCTRMSGLIYVASALVLGGIFPARAVKLYRRYSDRLAHATFRYAIVYLARCCSRRC